MNKGNMLIREFKTIPFPESLKLTSNLPGSHDLIFQACTIGLTLNLEEWSLAAITDVVIHVCVFRTHVKKKEKQTQSSGGKEGIDGLSKYISYLK